MNETCSFDNVEFGAIADLLANCHDWFVPDLRFEVGQVLSQQFPALSPENRLKILESFFTLSTEERMSPYFDHIEFVRKILTPGDSITQ